MDMRVPTNTSDGAPTIIYRPMMFVCSIAFTDDGLANICRTLVGGTLQLQYQGRCSSGTLRAGCIWKKNNSYHNTTSSHRGCIIVRSDRL